MANNPGFEKQRQRTLAGLNDDMIDAPILRIVKGFNHLTFCYTLQCCYGHFLYDGQRDPKNLDPLPDVAPTGAVEFRIAYMAYCLDDSREGRELMDKLKAITTIDPGNIQFCSSRWFWRR